jgi:hypothetical protein
MVHVSSVPTVERVPNDSYSIKVKIMIVTSCIRFHANIWVASRCKMAFGDMFMYTINKPRYVC